MKFVLEVCANSVQSAINASRAGASRIELCENLELGGTTPSLACIKLTRQHTHLPIHVLVRPRLGDFVYSDLEFKQIKQEIADMQLLDIQGIVCGVLHPDGIVDTERTAQLVALAKPLNFTFHRAFDFTPTPLVALDAVIGTGATHILTSGAQSRATLGAPLLRKLVEKAGSRINIIVGGGVNASNIGSLIETGAQQFHMSGSSTYPSKSTYRPENLTLIDQAMDPFTLQQSSPEKISAVVNILQKDTYNSH